MIRLLLHGVLPRACALACALLGLLELALRSRTAGNVAGLLVVIVLIRSLGGQCSFTDVVVSHC
jgi:hypothetical protein